MDAKEFYQLCIIARWEARARSPRNPGLDEYPDHFNLGPYPVTMIEMGADRASDRNGPYRFKMSIDGTTIESESEAILRDGRVEARHDWLIAPSQAQVVKLRLYS